MQKYEAVQKLSSIEFRRLTGVRKEAFAQMITIIKEAEGQRRSQGGKPPRLTIEDKLLMALEYLREYRTYFHLGQSYGVSESACYRNCKWVEDTLIKSKLFSLPGKKTLLKSDTEFEVILVDATETPFGLRFNLIAGIHNWELKYDKCRFSNTETNSFRS
jgi:hypothetical protein